MPAEVGGFLPHQGNSMGHQNKPGGRAAEGDAARKFIPLGLSGLASFVTVSRGHRPNCKSGATWGEELNQGSAGASPIQ